MVVSLKKLIPLAISEIPLVKNYGEIVYKILKSVSHYSHNLSSELELSFHTTNVKAY